MIWSHPGFWLCGARYEASQQALPWVDPRSSVGRLFQGFPCQNEERSGAEWTVSGATTAALASTAGLAVKKNCQSLSKSWRHTLPSPGIKLPRLLASALLVSGATSVRDAFLSIRQFMRQSGQSSLYFTQETVDVDTTVFGTVFQVRCGVSALVNGKYPPEKGLFEMMLCHRYTQL